MPPDAPTGSADARAVPDDDDVHDDLDRAGGAGDVGDSGTAVGTVDGRAGDAGDTDDAGRDDTGRGADVDGGEPPARGSALGRVVVIGVVVALVAMWGYVVYLAFGPGRQPPVDRLDDPSFARAAEDRCAAALDDVEGLPLAQESPTPRDRAEVLAQANTAFTVMLEDLRGLARLAPAGDQRQRVREWLTDWETYLQDRVRYAEDLRTDPGARFLISEKEGTGRHITGWIDEFAKANRMPSCATPTDV